VVHFAEEAGDISILSSIDSNYEADPITYSMDSWVLSAVIRQWQHEADCSPPSSAVVMNEWSYTITSPLGFNHMHRDNLTLLLLMLSITTYLSLMLNDFCASSVSMKVRMKHLLLISCSN
jgi:hypothetical protein